MSCYSRLIEASGLNAGSSMGEGNKDSATYVLLSALDACDTRTDTYTNASHEVTYRLGTTLMGSPFGHHLKEFLSDQATKFGAY